MSNNINDLLTTISNFIEGAGDRDDFDRLAADKQAARDALAKLYDILSPDKAVHRDQCLGGKPYLK